MRYFKLDADKKPVEVTAQEYADWRRAIFGIPICSIGRTKVNNTILSTVFLGMVEDGEEVLPFETMIYDGSFPVQKYATWEEAQEGHVKKVKELTSIIKPE